jgi:hypothetical protein
MAAGSSISGIAVGVIATGGFLVYTGIENVSMVDGLRQILGGKPIEKGPQTVTNTGAPETVPSSAFPNLSAPVVGSSTTTSGGTDKASLQTTAQSLLATRGWSSEWAAFNALVNSESGWRMDATNPSSKAYGLAQMLAPSGGLAGNKQKYVQYGGDPNTGVGQLTAMLNYIQQRYGSPSAAWAFHQSHNWY